MARKTAVLIDGAFFIKRYRALYSDWKEREKIPQRISRDMWRGVLTDLAKANKFSGSSRELYRILFYDCPPMSGEVENPIDLSRYRLEDSKEAKFRLSFHEDLKRMRKVALRLGHLSGVGNWIIDPNLTKKIVKGTLSHDKLRSTAVKYDVNQKGVDMKIGLDIASLSYKKSVDQIILIAGDSDFVPAAKLARREGIDILLDPMGNNINPELHEHIDGLLTGSWERRGPTRKEVPREKSK